MPKRSNLFQRMIRVLYEAEDVTGVTVQESAELLERTTGRKREIDILLETIICGERIRIAIETRDRTNVDDVTWIDGLIGKYMDLDVQKTVAISASGFSETAIQKAMAHGIRTLTATEAVEYDWSQEFAEFRVAKFSRHDSFKVAVETEDLSEAEIDPESEISAEDGVIVANVAGFTSLAMDHHRKNMEEHLRSQFFEYFKVLADLDKSLLTVSELTPTPPLYLHREDETRVRVVRVEVVMLSRFDVATVPMRRVKVRDCLISAAELRDFLQGHAECILVQDVQKPHEIAVQFGRKPC